MNLGKIYDGINFLQKQTFKKVFNSSKLLFSYYFSKWIGRPKIKGLPMTISIEPTTACNLRCPECPSGLRSFTRETGNLKVDFFKKVILEIGETLQFLIFYFQGEPYINPKFLEMVHFAHKKGIYTITSTNGHFLNDLNAKKTIESGLDRLIISIDGTTQEVYEQYRKEGNLENVLQGAKNIVRWKRALNSKKPYVIFQYLVVKPNEHQIPGIYKLAKEIGVDEVKLKTAQIYNFKNGNPLIPTIEKYSRYKRNHDGRYSFKYKISNHCWKQWHANVITWDGKVLPCCFDKDAQHQLGDMNKKSFKEIWVNEKNQSFRKKLFTGRDQIDICSNCSEGCKVWA